MSAVLETSKYIMNWGFYGVVAVPICDGDTRPVTKIATHKNQSTREKIKIKATLICQKLNELKQQLNSQELTDDDYAAAKAEWM